MQYVQTDTGQTRAVLYLRISLDRSGQMLAVDRQREACRAIAEARRWSVIGEYVDNDASASKRGAVRLGYEAMVEAYGRGEFDALLCWDLDRLTRQPRQLEDWLDAAEDRGLQVVTANGEADLATTSGRLFCRIKISVARSEIELKSARQKAANAQRAQQGKPMWVRRPFGYERNGSLRPVEAEAIRRAYADLLRGRSLGAIGRDFDAAGLPPTGSSDSWSVPSVRTLLRSPRNAAKSTHLGEIVGEGTWQPIIAEETWRAVDRILADPTRHSGGSGRVENLLSGIALCAVCERTVKVQYRNGRKGAPDSYAVYMCPQGHVSLPVDFAEGRALIELTRAADEIGVLGLVPEDTEDLAPLRAMETKLLNRQSELGESFAAGEITRTTMQAASKVITAELSRVQDRIADAGRFDALAGTDIEALAEEFVYLDLDRQRSIIRSAFASVTINPRGRGRGPLRAQHIDFVSTPEWGGPAR